MQIAKKITNQTAISVNSQKSSLKDQIKLKNQEKKDQIHQEI